MKRYNASHFTNDGKKSYYFRNGASNLMIRHGNGEKQLYFVIKEPKTGKNEYFPAAFKNGALDCLKCGMPYDRHHLITCNYVSPLEYKRTTNYPRNTCKFCNLHANKHYIIKNGIMHYNLEHAYEPYVNEFVKLNI